MWGVVHHRLAPSVIVLVVHDMNIGSVEHERDTPVLVDPDTPGALASTFQLMKEEAGGVHVLWQSRDV